MVRATIQYAKQKCDPTMDGDDEPVVDRDVDTVPLGRHLRFRRRFARLAGLGGT